jgi:hypothetical protein
LNLDPVHGRNAQKVFGRSSPGMKHWLMIFGMVGGLNLMMATRAQAGPPFLTDDPEPVDYSHWETYLFAATEPEAGGYLINGPAVELNYGAFPDTQLSVTIPLTTVGGGGPSAAGLGDILAGVKYRFWHETNGWPQIAVYPQVTLPSGDANRGLGNGRPWYQLPLWLQKSWGPWTTYGGGGVAWNSAPGQRDYPFGGWLLQRDLNEHLMLGGEIYVQGRDANSDSGFAALNFGGSIKLDEHFSLPFSAGRSVAGDLHTFWYFGLNWDW